MPGVHFTVLWFYLCVDSISKEVADSISKWFYLCADCISIYGFPEEKHCVHCLLCLIDVLVVLLVKDTNIMLA